MRNRSFAGDMVGDIAQGASLNLPPRLRAAALHLRKADASGDAEELRKARAEAASAVGDAERLLGERQAFVMRQGTSLLPTRRHS